MPPPQLSPGTYRIVQEVFYPGLWHIGMDGSGKNVCAEFVLQ
jgi:hypothetical protein